MKLRYQFSFDNNTTLIKEFEDSQDYLEFIRINGHIINQMSRLVLPIDEQTKYTGNFLSE